jgi:POT family proton-dependent oligopeptide transporter
MSSSFYPVVWLCFNQNQTNLISQAGQMMTYGIPNDAFQALNPIFVLVAVPLLEKFFYPRMHNIGLSPRAPVRITLGFALFAVSMASAAGVQQTIYNAPPCYNLPLECPGSNSGKIPNAVSVFIQVPTFFIGAIGEVLFSVSGSEYAYNKAAPHMKSTLQAFTMLTVALGSALAIAVSPVSHNPYLVIVFSSFAAAVVVVTTVFGWLFWSQN